MTFKQFKEKYQRMDVEHFKHTVSSNPLVSILVQTYNHEAYIAECLDAILIQKTDFNFEILLGEDASTDSTRKICLQYAKKYPEKIRLFLHHPSNKIMVLGIPTGNFNAFYNFYQATGEYIAFCEGDDYWNDPLKLQKQINFLEKNPDYILSYHTFEEKYESSLKNLDQNPLEQPTKDISQKDLTELNYHPLLSTVCFRNRLNDLPEEVLQVINVDSFLLSVLGNYGKAKFQEEIQASAYRRHSGGAWSVKRKELGYKLKILSFKKIIDHYDNKENKELRESFKIKLKNVFKMQILHSIKTGNPKYIISAILFYLKKPRS